MKKINFGKKYLSPEAVGYFRFYAGIAAGVLSAFAISLAFNYGREVHRLFTVFGNLIVPDEETFQTYNLFFACLSASLAVCIMTFVWLGSPARTCKNRRKRQYGSTIMIVFFFIVLSFIMRGGSVLPFILYAHPEYNGELQLHKTYPYLFVLFPVVVFMQGWFSLRPVFRLGYATLYAVGACVLMSGLLLYTTTVDQSVVNNAYENRKDRSGNDHIHTSDTLRKGLAPTPALNPESSEN